MISEERGGPAAAPRSAAGQPVDGVRTSDTVRVVGVRGRRRERMLPYLLLAPAATFLTFVHFVPMGVGLYLSTLRLNQGHLLEFLGAPFVGLDNYSYVLFEQGPIRDQFLSALRNTIVYVGAANALSLVCGLLAALLVTREFRGRGVVRTLLLVPWIVPTFVVGILWGFMWQSDTGIVNYVLHDVLRLPVRPFWLVGPLTLVAISVPTAWRGFPYAMLMMSAGLTTIPPDLYEAADVDGATAWQKLRYITLPLLRPVIAVAMLFGLIGTIYGFNIVFAMFGNGMGYAGEWGDILPTMIFRNSFAGLNFGVGGAASVLLMLVCMVMVGGWYWTFRRELSIR